MRTAIELLQRPWVQRGVRAALAAGLSWHEFQPHRRGLDRVDDGTGWVLADALDGLAGVVRIPYHATDDVPDDRDAAITAAVTSLDRLTTLLRTAEVADAEGYFALGAVTVGMHRSLRTMQADVRFPQPA